MDSLALVGAKPKVVTTGETHTVQIKGPIKPGSTATVQVVSLGGNPPVAGPATVVNFGDKEHVIVFKLEVPENAPPGEYDLNITWTDADGVGHANVAYPKMLSVLSIELQLPQAEIVCGQTVSGTVKVGSGVSLEGSEVYVAVDANGLISVLEAQPLKLGAGNSVSFTLSDYGIPSSGNVVAVWMSILPGYVIARGLEIRDGPRLGDVSDGLEMGRLVMGPVDMPFIPPYVSLGSEVKWERRIVERVSIDDGAIVFDVNLNTADLKALRVKEEKTGKEQINYGAAMEGYIVPLKNLEPTAVQCVQIMTRNVLVDGQLQAGPSTSFESVDGQLKKDDPRYRKVSDAKVKDPKTKKERLVGKKFVDHPTIPDPWDQTKNKHLQVDWSFKTWVLTGRDTSLRYYGYFEWTVVLDLNVGTDEASTTINDNKCGAGATFRWVSSDGRSDSAADKELRAALKSGYYLAVSATTGKPIMKNDGDFLSFVAE